MPQAIAGFRASHPGVEVTLAEGEPEEIGPRLRAGEFDLVLLFEFRGVGERLDAGVRRFELFEDPLDLALPAGHPLAGREELRLEDLREEAWVQTSAASPCARHVVRSCHAAGFEPRVSFESDDYLTVQGLVAAGVGVALIPRLALAGSRDDIVDPRAQPGEPGAQGVRGDPAGGGGDPRGRDDARHPARALPRPRRRRGAPERRTAPGSGGGSSSLLVV